MKKFATLLTLIASISSSGCSPPAPPQVVTVGDSLCTATTRYRATEGQKAAFRADPGLWEPLVDWLLGFDKVRDARC